MDFARGLVAMVKQRRLGDGLSVKVAVKPVEAFGPLSAEEVSKNPAPFTAGLLRPLCPVETWKSCPKHFSLGVPEGGNEGFRGDGVVGSSMLRGGLLLPNLSAGLAERYLSPQQSRQFPPSARLSGLNSLVAPPRGLLHPSACDPCRKAAPAAPLLPWLPYFSPLVLPNRCSPFWCGCGVSCSRQRTNTDVPFKVLSPRLLYISGPCSSYPAHYLGHLDLPSAKSLNFLHLSAIIAQNTNNTTRALIIALKRP